MRGPGGQHVTYKISTISSEAGGANIVDSYNSLRIGDVDSRGEIIDHQETSILVDAEEEDTPDPLVVTIQNSPMAESVKS